MRSGTRILVTASCMHVSWGVCFSYVYEPRVAINNDINKNITASFLSHILFLYLYIQARSVSEKPLLYVMRTWAILVYISYDIIARSIITNIAI